MALYKKLNYATGTLASGIADDAVGVVLNAGHSIITDTGIDNNFIGVFFSESESSPYQDAGREIVDAYRTNTNTFTITRAKEGTSAKAWSQGDNFMLIASAGVFDEYETEINSKVNLDQTTPQTITGGSPAFSEGVDMANDKYLKGKNYAGTEDVNIIKVNTDNEAEVGVTMNIGTIEVEDDAGAVTVIDMGVTSASADGTEMSYVVKIDGNNLLKIYTESDGAGGVDTFKVQLLNKAVLTMEDSAGTTHTYTSDTDGSLIIS